MTELFQPLTLGALNLANRVVMAPMTRLRSGAEGVPGDLNVEYYAQRASVGMIVTEGTFPGRAGRGYPGQPGLVTEEQVAGWRRVTDAVHAAGGTITVQLMHAGRASHPDINGNRTVLGPSPVAISGSTYTSSGKQDYPVPGEANPEQLAEIIAEHADAARRAIEAGFDGVEVHAGNGYLLHQFLAPGANLRDDDYGGSPAGRARLAVEVATAVSGVIGAERTGIRISPANQQLGCAETEPAETAATYAALIDGLNPLELAYLSVVHKEPFGELAESLSRAFNGPVLFNAAYAGINSPSEAAVLLAAPHIDAVVVGRAALANPDLVERWRSDSAVNEPRKEFFYSSSAEGYTDYPYHF